MAVIIGKKVTTSFTWCWVITVGREKLDLGLIVEMEEFFLTEYCGGLYHMISWF